MNRNENKNTLPYKSYLKKNKNAVLRIRIRDPGLGAFLTPGSGIRDGRKSVSGSGIRDEQSGSYFLELRNRFFAFLGLKCLNALMRIRDPGWRQFGSGMKKVGSGIRDKHPGSATLQESHQRVETNRDTCSLLKDSQFTWAYQ
jgi:hypothetical protein